MLSRLPSRPLVIANAVSVLFLLSLYSWDLVDWSRATRAPVAAMSEPPNVGFAVLGVSAGLATIGLWIFALRKPMPRQWRGWRLPPIATVIIAFVDFLVLNPTKVAIDSQSQSLNMANAFAQELSLRSPPQGLVDDPKALDELLADVTKRNERPPYLVHGERPRAWALSVSRDCDGPARDANGAPVGTLIVCVARDKQSAWVSPVGLAAGQTFGDPAVLPAVRAVVQAPPAPEEANEPTPAPDSAASGGFQWLAQPTDQPDASTER